MSDHLINERWVADRVHPEWQDGTAVRYVDSVSGKEICTVYGGGDDRVVVTRIARLIAAAPDMYEALELIDKRLRDCASTPISAAEAYDSFYQSEVSAAIARAKGEA